MISKVIGVVILTGVGLVIGASLGISTVADMIELNMPADALQIERLTLQADEPSQVTSIGVTLAHNIQVEPLQSGNVLKYTQLSEKPAFTASDAYHQWGESPQKAGRNVR